jgi:hypothetical protein
MPSVSTKDEFIEELKKFTTTNNNDNLTINFTDDIITIDEPEEDGKGKIDLDISGYSDNTFFVKIDNQPRHSIGKCLTKINVIFYFSSKHLYSNFQSYFYVIYFC